MAQIPHVCFYIYALCHIHNNYGHVALCTEMIRDLQYIDTSDDLYQENCAHEKKVHGLQWAQSMVMVMMANKRMLLIL